MLFNQRIFIKVRELYLGISRFFLNKSTSLQVQQIQHLEVLQSVFWGTIAMFYA